MEIDSIQDLTDAIKQQPVVMQRSGDRQQVILPEGWSVRDISDLLPPPDRVKQKVELLTLKSFVDYVTKFKVPDTVIFANEGDGTYDAVVDYHTAPAADRTAAERDRGDCDHTARYACPKSDQWKAWTGLDGKAQMQIPFAQFIETNLIDITKPVSADMLQIVLGLQVHKSAEFKSDLRLDNGGTKLSYDETVRGSTRTGDLVIPDTFEITIPVFIDGPRYAVQARLRYRLDDSKLNMWYELVRPLDVYREAVKAVSKEIQAGLGDLSFWIGKRA